MSVNVNSSRIFSKLVTSLLILIVVLPVSGTFILKADAMDGGVWISRKSTPTARSNLAAVAVNKKIYAIGGFIYKDGKYFATSIVEVYDVLTDSWSDGMVILL